MLIASNICLSLQEIDAYLMIWKDYLCKELIGNYLDQSNLEITWISYDLWLIVLLSEATPKAYPHSKVYNHFVLGFLKPKLLQTYNQRKGFYNCFQDLIFSEI